MKIRIRIGVVALAATFLATFFAILFGCYPIEKHWQINPDPGSTCFCQGTLSQRDFETKSGVDRCQPAVSKLQVAVLITLNISTDFYLMSIPLPVRNTPLMPRTSTDCLSDDLEIALGGQEETSSFSNVQRRTIDHGIRSSALRPHSQSAYLPSSNPSSNFPSPNSKFDASRTHIQTFTVWSQRRRTSRRMVHPRILRRHPRQQPPHDLLPLPICNPHARSLLQHPLI